MSFNNSTRAVQTSHFKNKVQVLQKNEFNIAITNCTAMKLMTQSHNLT